MPRVASAAQILGKKLPVTEQKKILFFLLPRYSLNWHVIDELILKGSIHALYSCPISDPLIMPRLSIRAGTV